MNLKRILGLTRFIVWTSGMSVKRHDSQVALVPTRRVQQIPQASTLESMVRAEGVSEPDVFVQALEKTQMWPSSESSRF